MSSSSDPPPSIRSATSPQQRHDDDVALIDILSSDAGSIVVDCFTLADYQRLLCTSKTLHDVMVDHNNNDSMTTKDFLREREILWLFNQKRHDPLTKRMIDCIRLGNYHVEVISKWSPQALTLAELAGSYVHEVAFRYDDIAEMSDEHFIDIEEEEDEEEGNRQQHSPWRARENRGAPPRPTTRKKKCVSQFCQGDGNPSRLYLVDEDRLYCGACLHRDVCLAMRFFALKNVQTISDHSGQAEKWGCFELKWEDHKEGESFIVQVFSCEDDSNGDVIYDYFVGGPKHKQLLEQKQEEYQAAMERAAQRHRHTETAYGDSSDEESENSGSSDEDSEDDDDAHLFEWDWPAPPSDDSEDGASKPPNSGKQLSKFDDDEYLL